MSEDTKPTKAVNVKLDLETAADLADFFVARGKPRQALQTYSAILSLDPHAEGVRRQYAELLFRVNGDRSPSGTIERGQMLLGLMGLDVLTEAIESAYFENLERLLNGRDRLAAPGTLVLGLGSGRCGSTSLARSLASVENVCATHENPPMVHWRPTPEQLRVHCKRFRMLLAHFGLVFDSAHWWLNAMDHMTAEFGGLKMIGLVRDPDACARSFLERKGTGRNAINHWVDHDGTFWKPALWDRFYPSYEPGRFGLNEQDDVSQAELPSRQHQLVKTYVEDYNESLAQLKDRVGERLLILRTEELSERRTQDQVQEFLGIGGLDFQDVFNRGSTRDGDSQDLQF